jgi:hypothetical protein
MSLKAVAPRPAGIKGRFFIEILNKWVENPELFLARIVAGNRT